MEREHEMEATEGVDTVAIVDVDVERTEVAKEDYLHAEDTAYRPIQVGAGSRAQHYCR